LHAPFLVRFPLRIAIRREQTLRPRWRRPYGRGPPVGAGVSGAGPDRELIPERIDVTMLKYFTPPIVVPLALVLLVVIAALVRM
jgi:hypothetical protein